MRANGLAASGVSLSRWRRRYAAKETPHSPPVWFGAGTTLGFLFVGARHAGDPAGSFNGADHGGAPFAQTLLRKTRSVRHPPHSAPVGARHAESLLRAHRGVPHNYLMSTSTQASREMISYRK